MGNFLGGYTPGSRNFGFDVPGSFNLPSGNDVSFRPLTEGGNIGQVDVRTKNMRALEEASLPALLQILLNPQGVAQQFGGAAGQVPQAASWNASNPAAGALNTSPYLDTMGQQGGFAGFLNNLFGGSATGSTAPTVPPDQPGNPPHPYTGQPANQGSQPSQPAQQQPGQAPPVTLQPNPALPNATAPTLPSSSAGWIPPGTNVSYHPGLLSPQPGQDQGAPGVGGTYTFDFSGFPGGGLTGDALNQFNAALSGAGWDLSKLGLAGLPVSSHATGGLLDPNGINIVGEAGPEAIVGNMVKPLTPPTGPVTDTGMLPTMPQLPQMGGFQPSAMQGSGTGSAMRLLEQNPEMQAFTQAQQLLGGNAGNAGQNVVNAMQPVFQQNLQHSLGALRNMSPSTFNTGIQGQGADLARASLNDFNLQAAQALMQGQGQNATNMGVLGQLAGQAGNGAFNRMLGAGQLAGQQELGLRSQDLQRQLGLMQLAQQQQQFMSNYGLQSQQQAYNQAVNPTLQLLLAALGQATPTAFQTVISQ